MAWYCVVYAIINTSYQKLPFGSGDYYPDKLLFHQALPSRFTLVELSYH